jgi:hypothetical protein
MIDERRDRTSRVRSVRAAHRKVGDAHGVADRQWCCAASKRQQPNVADTSANQIIKE